MSDAYTLIADLSLQVQPPVDGTLSRTIFQDEHMKVVLFGFAPGQELSEHTASTPALMHFLEGEAEITLGAETKEVRGNTWIHMTAKLPHSIRAKTPVVMLLLLLKSSMLQG